MANYTVNAYNNGGTGGSVNMRSGPSTNDGIVIRVPHCATVTGTKSGTWSYMTYNTYTGYMMSVYLDEQSGGFSIQLFPNKKPLTSPCKVPNQPAKIK